MHKTHYVSGLQRFRFRWFRLLNFPQKHSNIVNS